MRLDRVLRQKAHSGVRLVRAVIRSARDDGFRDAGHMLNGVLHGFLPSNKKRADRKNAFDLKYGTDTSGIVRVASMEISSPNYVYAAYYKASTSEHVHGALQSLPVGPESFTFVDFGSGKGLALMVASLYPFRNIVGVEFAADLHRIAIANLEKFRPAERKCTKVESVHADATQWPVPADPLICYFYEPFDKPILSKVINRLEASYGEAKRPILILYHQPPTTSVLRTDSMLKEQVVLKNGIFRKIDNWKHEPYVLYAASATSEAAVA
ncbi:MAG TPA: class I SAM-dependent methyltransferase [Bryobacteraceae bacterium]|nr:class I SAM-dependent methyltransferase [Bryobacteraceae bacterium]